MVLASKDFVSPVDLIATTTAFFDGEIDLDPASSEHANSVLQAKRYFTWRNNGLLQDWTCRNLYLFPPRELLLKSEQPKPTALFTKTMQYKKSAQRVWLELCYQKWLKKEFSQAITLITSTEVALLVTQKIGLDFPMCVLKKKPKLLNDDEKLKPLRSTKVLGFVFYFPPPDNLEESIQKFSTFYSTLGRVYC